jgi:uncharacterized protein
MNAGSKALFLGGFADSAPPPVASVRHFRRFLYIAIGIALGMLLQARRSSPTPTASKVPLYFGLIAVELALVWFVTAGIRARGFNLTDLIGRRWRTALDGFVDVLFACGTAALLRFTGPLLFRLLGRWSSQTGFLLPATHFETAIWILVSFVAGACEELVFRGYLQRQLWSLTRSFPLALLLQAVIFGFGHIYQGWRPAAVTATYGLAFGLVAAWRRSIIPGAIAHAIVDVIGGLRL